jgi:peptide methionine sulfoxide reductase msrA/msrB
VYAERKLRLEDANDMQKRTKTIGWVSVLILAILGCKPASSQDEGTSDGKVVQASDRVRTGENVQKDKSGARYSKSGYDITPLPREKVVELASKLDPEAYSITQSAETERPFCGRFEGSKKDGIYTCAVCGLPLFSSENKFDSGTGWPSFYREFDRRHVARRTDRSYGRDRTEINCARCGAHLGHVFDDGPKPTGERHCLNSASLKFHEKDAELPPESRPVQTETAYFAGGCFWGIEHYFDKGPGVIEAISGYMQGKVEKPTYKDVCSDTTGHAETVKVVFDPKRISYRRLLEAFFEMHDPTQLNRQGPDHGQQYRSGIWYASEEQRREAERFVKEIQASDAFKGRKITTQIEPAKTFWPAEEYHQDYVDRTGGVCHVADPW